MSANYWTSSQREKWQFTREEIAIARNEINQVEKQMFGDSPALIGCKYDINMRIYLHQLIVKLGRRLNFRQIILSTAEVYLTRFLLRASIKEVNIYLLVATCVYVACKIEEYPQHIRTILSEARNCWPEFIPNDLTRLAEFEFYLIDELECYLVVHHPYNSLIEITQLLKNYGEADCRLDISPEELQSCWSIINDSYILDLHLLFPPHIIAISSLYLTLIMVTDLPGLDTNVTDTKPQKLISNVVSNNSSSNRTVTGNANNNAITNSNENGNSTTNTTSTPGSLTDTSRNVNGQLSDRRRASSSHSSTAQKCLKKGKQSDSSLNKAQLKRGRFSQTSLIQFNPRVEAFIKFLAASNVNLDEIIETVQEMLTLYDSWNYYDEVSVRNAAHSMLLALNRTHNV
ncbi:hypothetical protein FOA43_003612 [Brettanomyces nanus]|uniref:Cyclin-like domain-containing protein n=1 Tax=Eeniella nana TaxID=13502 RepID=A0A875S4J1_EENNA|nr:uncharacterized protein FOA43_003612 [Brettanomyces nanus]QPG76226.1 hypothetical protein FOA43_003612 [Brettanomyces nanus]